MPVNRVIENYINYTDFRKGSQPRDIDTISNTTPNKPRESNFQYNKINIPQTNVSQTWVAELEKNLGEQRKENLELREKFNEVIETLNEVNSDLDNKNYEFHNIQEKMKNFEYIEGNLNEKSSQLNNSIQEVGRLTEENNTLRAKLFEKTVHDYSMDSLHNSLEKLQSDHERLKIYASELETQLSGVIEETSKVNLNKNYEVELMTIQKSYEEVTKSLEEVLNDRNNLQEKCSELERKNNQDDQELQYLREKCIFFE